MVGCHWLDMCSCFKEVDLNKNILWYFILKDGLPISRVTTNKNFQIQKSSLRFFWRFLTKTRNFADKYKKVNTNVANANEEWPLGKLFLPWTMVSWSPWQFRSCLPFSSSFKNLKISYSLPGFPWVWGQHLEIKQRWYRPDLSKVWTPSCWWNTFENS